MVDSADDTISEGANQGVDTVQSSVSMFLGANLENLTLTGYVNLMGGGNTLDNVITGNDGDNLLIGGTGADTIRGGLGNDSLYAANYNDSPDAQADMLYGGAGDDEYHANASDMVVEQAGEGVDTINLCLDSPTYALPDNVENLNVVQTTWSYGTTLTGNALDNVIVGDANVSGAIIDGGLGADTMAGGSNFGVVYFVDNPGDVIVSGGSLSYNGASIGGVDTVVSSVDWTLQPALENLTLVGSTAVQGIGNSLANVITGNDADNLIEGMDGNDTLTGGNGSDTLDGGAGDDRLVDGPGAWTPGADVLLGGAGNDTLISYSDGDWLDGGAGNDTISMADTGSGLTTVVFGHGYGLDMATGSSTSGTQLTRRILFTPDVQIRDLQLSRSGADLQLAVSATDVLTIGSFFNDETSLVPTGMIDDVKFADGTVLDTQTLIDRLSLGNSNSATAAADVIFGTSGADTLQALGGNDRMFAGAGNDDLSGGTGNDTLYGGAGDDTYRFAAGDGQDLIVDSAGANDTLVFGAGIAASNVAGRRSGDDLLLSIANSTDQITVQGFFSGGDAQIDGADFSDGTVWDSGALAALTTGMTIVGTAGDDALTGGANGDTLNGGAGNDVLSGLDGDDELTGGAGSDSLYGGAGTDTYVFAPGSGHDFVYDPQYSSSGANVMRLTGVSPQQVTVSTDGTSLYLVTQGSSDWIELFGSDGSSTVGAYRVRFDDGSVWDAAALQSMLNPRVASESDDVWMGSTGNDTASLLGGDDLVTEMQGNNSIDAGAGNDQVWGGQDNDVFHGAIGNDTLDGGDGNNLLDGGAGDDEVDGSMGDNVLVGGSGDDYLWAGDSRSNVILFNRGDGQDYAEVGESGQLNVLSLGGGIAQGDITLRAVPDDGTVFLAVGGADGVELSVPDAASRGTLTLQIIGTNSVQAFDLGAVLDDFDAACAVDPTIDTWSAQASLQVHAIASNPGLAYGGQFAYRYATEGSLDSLSDAQAQTLLAVADFTATPQPVAAGFVIGTSGGDVLGGTASDDHLFGLDGADSLTGLAGNDTIDGGAGADTMKGGAGDDTYVVDNTADVVTESSNQGYDTVLSSVSFTLPSNVEVLQLTGDAAINGTGNGLANAIIGNAAANVLSGGSGADTMAGGDGDDTYVVDNVADVVVEQAGEGSDLVKSSVTYTLSTDVEDLTLTGSSAINGVGNALDNVLIGNSGKNKLTGGAGNDTLDGGAGSDTMIGGAGDDTYVVNTSTDVVTENANEGIDTILSGVTWTLGSNLENLTLTGTSAIKGTGNAADNVLIGNSGANTLTGGAGNDTLDGGAGNDSLLGGTGDDTYFLGTGSGADLITENDATAGNTDLLSVGAGVAIDQLWFRHVGNNLEVSIIGTTDKATIANWYTGTANHVEQFMTSDGHLLLDSQVANLVNAMASFAPPAAGQTTLPPNYQASLEPIIAANWH